MILLILPASILIVLVLGYPLIRYTWLSLHSISVLTGLEIYHNDYANWIRLFNDQRFWQDTYQTIRFAFFSVSLELLLALGIALLLDQKLKSRGITRTITILPWALPTSIMALTWRWIFNTPYGPLNQISSLLNLGDLNILSNPDLTWIATVIADVWKTTPFVALILLAGLQTIPNDLYEAFRLEGGNSLKALYKITLPLLKDYLLLALIFRTAQAFGVFDLIQVMTGGGPASSTESLAMYAYLNAMRFLDFGYSSTIIMGSFILMIIAAFLGTITIKNLFKYIQLKST